MNETITKTQTNAQMEAAPELPQVAPAAWVRETKDGFVLEAELPGVAESDLHVTVQDRTLVIEGDRRSPDAETGRLLRREFTPVRYRAAYELPEKVEAAGIRAALKHGVLRLTLPAREETKPHRIAVQAA